MAKCTKCLRGARLSITGLDKKTLQVGLGGAVIYLIPTNKGMEVTINSENLVEGDYAFATWNGENWIATCGNHKNNRT